MNSIQRFLDQHMERTAPVPRLSASANDERPWSDRQIVAMLHAALATELLSMLRCRHRHFSAHGTWGPAAGAAFLAHSILAQRNADALAARIIELGGEPDFAPDGLSQRSCTQFVEESGATDVAVDSMLAERLALRCYRMFIDFLGDRDAKSSRLLAAIVSGLTSFVAQMESPPANA